MTAPSRPIQIFPFPPKEGTATRADWDCPVISRHPRFRGRNVWCPVVQRVVATTRLLLATVVCLRWHVVGAVRPRRDVVEFALHLVRRLWTSRAHLAADVVRLRFRPAVLEELLRLVLVDVLRDGAALLVEVAEDAGVGRTVHDTRRVETLLDAVAAERALLDDALRSRLDVAGPFFGHVFGFVPVEHPRVVRTGCHAVATADTLVIVDLDDAVVAGVRRVDRTDLDAGRILAVLTRRRLVLHVQRPAPAVFGIATRGRVHLLAALSENSVPELPHRNVVLLFARHGARLTPDTPLLVDY